MASEMALISIAAFMLAAVLTGMVRRFALSRGLLDIPNPRSSHSQVTPRGGGLAIVATTSVTAIALAWLDRIPSNLLFALLVGGAAVAAIGLMDDHRPMRARTRLAVHGGAAVWAVAWIGAPLILSFGGRIVELSWFGAALAVLGIVWAINLFNFMDGIDGIAACEVIFMTCGAAVLIIIGGDSSRVMALGLVLGASCLGFLLWNWPPAKIFMGDVGSGYLGYVIGVLGLAAAHENPFALWPWLILGGVFFVDATVTLARRTARGDRVYEAHRSHAYQWLARGWGSHKVVTLAVTAVNLLWLLPCACIAVLNPSLAAWTAVVALTPLVIGAIAAGAGRREKA